MKKQRIIQMAAFAVMAASIAILAAYPEPAESEAAEENAVIPEENAVIIQEPAECCLPDAVAEETAEITLEAIREFAKRMEESDLERFQQMQVEQYLEPVTLPEDFSGTPDLTGMDTEGFLPYMIPEEYAREGGYLPEEVQIWAYARCRLAMVDYPTVLAVIEAESRYHHDAVGSSCIGYMQILPKWHKDRMEKLGVTDIADPYQNIAVGIDYLADLLERYGGNYGKALTAYNCGPEGAKKIFLAGKESNSYARRVMERASEIGRGFVDAAENG